MNSNTFNRAGPLLGSALLAIGSCFAGIAYAVQADAKAATLTGPESALDTACFATLNRPVQEVGAEQVCDAALSDAAADPGPLGRVRQARVYSAIAMLQAQRNDLRTARDNMNRALALAGDDNIVIGNQGNLLLREGAYGNALAAYNEVLGRLLVQAPESPLHAPMYLNRSLALRALGRYDEASKDYQLYLILTGVESPPASQVPPPATDSDYSR